MKRGLVLSCLLFVLTNYSFAQFGWSGTELSSLEISPSALLNSYGNAGISAPLNDAFSFYLNPAHLGLNAGHNNLSIGFFPEKTHLFNLPKYELSTTAISTGWQFGKNPAGFPFRLGLGYVSSRLNCDYVFFDDMGSIPYTNDLSDAFTLGFGFDYYLSFNLGITYKHIVSSFPRAFLVGPIPWPRVSVDAFDFGFIITAPIVKLLCNTKENEHSGLQTGPFLDLSIGYAQRNNGGEISYFPESHGMPIPRTATLGFTVSAGTYMELQPGNILKVFEADWSNEAEDLLVKGEYDQVTGEYKVNYQGFGGDINFWKNVILSEWDYNIIRHRGIRLEVGEVFEYSWGSVRNYRSLNTSGWGLRTKGLLKALRPLGSTAAFIADHFDIQYFYTSENSLANTELSSVSLSVNGIESLLQ